MDLWQIRGEVTVARKGAQRWRAGHLWIYRSDIEGDAPAEAGFVRVLDRARRRIGTAMYSPRSEIALRWICGKRVEPDRDLFRRRLRAAIDRRTRQLPDADACRLVHGEADLLPGIFVDRYDDCIALQTTCEAADRLEPALVELLVELLAPRAVVLRDDGNSRRHEGLERRVSVVQGEEPVIARFHEGNIEHEIDLLTDQKTGAFLDQTANHLLAGRVASGRALDCFTYHGGFALQLAVGCSEVWACDQSTLALERARANAERAGLDNIVWHPGDVFQLLPQWLEAKQRFDTVVIDPPALASGKKTVAAALRAYGELNAQAMQLLNPGGLLISCSCSGRITPRMFDEMLGEAAQRARRRVQILERRGAGPDHPVLAGVPETEYLKCRLLAVL